MAGLINSIDATARQLWRAQFVRSSWDPLAARPYLIKAWWRFGRPRP